MIVYNTPETIEAFRAKVIASGLRMYARTGMQPNRAYTPKAMMATASKITGKSFKPRAYLEAADALETWIITREAA